MTLSDGVTHAELTQCVLDSDRARPARTTEGGALADPATVIETNYDTALAIYQTRTPWRYDARFHVPRQHIRLVPVFQPPTSPVAQPD